MSVRKKVLIAIIPAAGFGTRMLPATKALPKEMLPVAGKPLIQYAVEEAAASGIEMVILVVRNHKSLIQDHFARDHQLESFLECRQMTEPAECIRRLTDIVDLRYVEQEKPLGLAHAISCAQQVVGREPFVVLLPDVIMVNEEPVTRQLISAYEQQGGSVVAIRQVEPSEMHAHGIVRVERPAASQPGTSVRVTGLVEKPSADKAPSRLGVFGRYLLEAGIWEAVARTHPDAKGEVQLTDALNRLCEKKPLFGLHFEGRHYDAGNRLGHLKANIELSLLDPQLRPSFLEYLSGLPAYCQREVVASSPEP
jgi:UTP--glucose-1-phosphate uridylyltransferase